MNSKTTFFLGADSNNGFVSYFRQLQEQKSSMQLLILKGGPGSGKSTLMKRIASFAETKGHFLEIIPCASDPSSFDAVIDYTQNFAIMDGTAPHTEDPTVPGALHHILYTGSLWDTKKLSLNSSVIKELGERISDCHRGASAYIGAAAKLLFENKSLCSKFLIFENALKIVDKISPNISEKSDPTIKKRLLSAVSVDGIKAFPESVRNLADKIYVIEDNYGAASDFIIKEIFHTAQLKNARCIICPCAVIPEKYDHIIFPEEKIAVVTQNNFVDFSFGEKISAEKIYKPLPFPEDLLLREKNASPLLSEAGKLIKKAKNLHDELEIFYREAMNFSGMDEIYSSIIERFYR